MFAFPHNIRRATEAALKKGGDRKFMSEKPGEVMGALAHADPFLDGNGRTTMAVHLVLADRARFSIDWSGSDTNAYLAVLTKEVHLPGAGCLDAYLKPLIGERIDWRQGDAILGGLNATGSGEGSTSDPAGDDQGSSS